VQAKWTNEILDEMLRALSRNRPDIPPDKLDRLRQLMIGAVRDCFVSGYEPLIEGLKLPDPADRHVLAAAIKAGPQVIVTSDLKHFPAAALRPLYHCRAGGRAPGNTHRELASCRILLIRALVAQRIEHLTTDRFSFPAVLTRKN
jgi:hypothetical protein